jgi:ubiquinone/menaquinone biosynthesis C-methylase UbiE
MASLDEATKTKASAGAKVPFRERFKAWWEGYELAPEQIEPVPVPAAPEEDDTKLRYEASKERWTQSRIDLVQQVWGDGLTGPGGTERILEMVKPLGLTPAMSVLDLGAGLGGAARIVADHFGTWVTGFEADRQLAEAGMEASTKAGLGKKAPVEGFEPENFAVKPKSYDSVFSKEFFFIVQDKERLLRQIELLLKDQGQIMFTDFVLPEAGHSSPALDAWRASEPVEPAPWAMEEYANALTALKLDVRINEDITKETRGLITQAWGTYMAGVNRSDLDNESVSAMVEEAELWARRVKVMESNDLKVCRFYAIKSQSADLLSDL